MDRQHYYINDHTNSFSNHATNSDWYWSISTDTDTWLQTYSIKSAMQSSAK